MDVLEGFNDVFLLVCPTVGKLGCFIATFLNILTPRSTLYFYILIFSNIFSMFNCSFCEQTNLVLSSTLNSSTYSNLEAPKWCNVVNSSFCEEMKLNLAFSFGSFNVERFDSCFAIGYYITHALVVLWAY